MRIRSTLMAWLVATILPVSQAGAQSVPGVSDTEIKIGVHLSLTGPASFVGQGSRVGLSLALAEINANGGINGRKLALSLVDDRGTPDGGVTAVRRLVDEEKVFFVLGAGTSTSTVPVLPYFERNGVPYYVSLASDPAVLEKFRKNVYSGATSTQVVFTEAMSKFVVEKFKPKRLTLIQCDQGHCTTGGPRVKALFEKSGVNVTVTTFNSGDTDFTGQIQQIKSSNPDVIFVYGEEGQVSPNLTYHEWFNQLGAKIIETFAAHDPAGALFRIDLRLRPEGTAGPLARCPSGGGERVFGLHGVDPAGPRGKTKGESAGIHQALPYSRDVARERRGRGRYPRTAGTKTGQRGITWHRTVGDSVDEETSAIGGHAGEQELRTCATEFERRVERTLARLAIGVDDEVLARRERQPVGEHHPFAVAEELGAQADAGEGHGVAGAIANFHPVG